MSQPKVSIIVPVYNVQLYLRDCLVSVLSQDYQYIEILAINDGSTDSSLEILKHFQQLDSRVKIFNKENGGLASARNYGLDHATGDYLLFLDSDDLLADNAVSTLVHLCEKESCDLVTFGLKKFYKNSLIASEPTEQMNTCKKITSLDMFRLVFDEKFKTKFCNGGYAANRFYRSSLLKDVRFDSTRLLYEDEDFTSRLIAKLDSNHSLLLLDEPLYYYRQRKSSLVHSKRLQRLFALYSCRRSILKLFANDTQKCPYIDKARLTTLIKLHQIFLSNNIFGGFKLFQKIIFSRQDITIKTKIPYLLGKTIASLYSKERLKKATIKNNALQYWE